MLENFHSHLYLNNVFTASVLFFPDAIKIVFLLFNIDLMPIGITRVGTSSIEGKKRALLSRVDATSSMICVRLFESVPGSLKPICPIFADQSAPNYQSLVHNAELLLLFLLNQMSHPEYTYFRLQCQSYQIIFQT